MMKNLLKFGLIIFALSIFMVSCQNEQEAKVREEAKTAIQNNTPVKPASTPVANRSNRPTPPKPVMPSQPKGPTTKMEFVETTADFGTIKEGEKASHVFKFKNTGTEPLILSNAKGSCGCTVPSWPREPIEVGGSGEVKVVFNSKGKKGARNQKVTITANTDPPQTMIYLKGNVTPDPNAPKRNPAQVNRKNVRTVPQKAPDIKIKK